MIITLAVYKMES